MQNTKRLLIFCSQSWNLSQLRGFICMLLAWIHCSSSLKVSPTSSVTTKRRENCFHARSLRSLISSSSGWVRSVEIHFYCHLFASFFELLRNLLTRMCRNLKKPFVAYLIDFYFIFKQFKAQKLPSHPSQKRWGRKRHTRKLRKHVLSKQKNWKFRTKIVYTPICVRKSSWKMKIPWVAKMSSTKTWKKKFQRVFPWIFMEISWFFEVFPEPILRNENFTEIFRT